MRGSDLWWHLAAGREMFEEGRIRLLDSWSYTMAGEPWRNSEWLSDLVFYAWVSAFGVDSLVYWKWLILGATFALLHRSLCRLGDPAAALLGCLAALVIAAPFLDLRPQLYSLLGFAILLNLALLKTPRLSLLLPVFLLWVNLHAGFLFGLMLLALLVFPWSAPLRSAPHRWGLPLLLAALITLVNPDGVLVYGFPLEYALNPDSPFRTIGEWRPPFEAGGIRSPLYPPALAAAGVLLLLQLVPALRRRVAVPLPVVAVALLCTAMSLTSRRFVILFALGFALLAAPYLAVLLRRGAASVLRWSVIGALLIFTGVRLAAYPLRADVNFHYLTAAYSFPEAIADYVEANDLEGPVFAYYNWGGYLHWRSGGALSVFIDGRANTLYNDAQYLDYVAVLSQSPGWLERVEESGARFFLWPHGSGGNRFRQRLRQSGPWVLLYEDSAGFLMARSDQRFPPTLRIPRDSVAAKVAQARTASARGDVATALTRSRAAWEQRPWDFRACYWLRRSLRAQRDTAGAERVMDTCRAAFPSRNFR